MTDNELLLSIAEIMDKKLDSKLTPIENDICEMKSDIYDIKTDVQTMKADILDLQSDVRFIKSDIQAMKADILDLQNNVHAIHLTQENIILPRLNTIESCYTTTYTRYKSYADKMAAAFVDIDLLKKVVSEHSEKLQKIS